MYFGITFDENNGYCLENNRQILLELGNRIVVKIKKIIYEGLKKVYYNYEDELLINCYTLQWQCSLCVSDFQSSHMLAVVYVYLAQQP